MGKFFLLLYVDTTINGMDFDEDLAKLLNQWCMRLALRSAAVPKPNSPISAKKLASLNDGRDTWHARLGVADEVQDFPLGDPYANPRR